MMNIVLGLLIGAYGVYFAYNSFFGPNKMELLSNKVRDFSTSFFIIVLALIFLFSDVSLWEILGL